MQNRTLLLGLAMLAWFVFFPGSTRVQAETTMSCPAGQYDMLDWMTMDSDLRSSQYFGGNANPLYTEMYSGKFYWTKGPSGAPWDIQLYDDNYIYLWITEWDWNNPSSYRKFTNNTNMPLAPRCAKGGFPGSTITVPNTAYEIFTSCNNYTTHSLLNAVNQVWGPYYISFGGSLPANLATLVVSYRYNCDIYYNNCGDKEEYYLAQRYGLVQWIHYQLVNGKYKQVQQTVYNQLKWGTASPNFVCF
ncbi:MAG TPA: hypothetical protein VFA89_13960 [Terriglobales bacterium]|nr:hypothetical protein [Terriglobales bacterium]